MLKLSTKSAPQSWVSHSGFTSAFLVVCAERKWTLSEYETQISEDKRDLTLRCCIQSDDLIRLPKGIRHRLTIQNVYQRKRALCAYAGVLVGNADVLISEVKLRKRRTYCIDIPFAIGQILDCYTDAALMLPRKIEGYKSVRIEKPKYSDLVLMEAARRGAISWSHLKSIDALFQSGSSWDLLLAYSQVLQRSKAQIQSDRAICFADLLPSDYEEPHESFF